MMTVTARSMKNVLALRGSVDLVGPVLGAAKKAPNHVTVVCGALAQVKKGHKQRRVMEKMMIVMAS